MRQPEYYQELRKKKRETLRRQIIEGRESAGWKLLKSRAKRHPPFFAEELEFKEMLKHTLFEPSKKILEELGVTNPNLQNKIFVQYLTFANTEFMIHEYSKLSQRKLDELGIKFNKSEKEEFQQKLANEYVKMALKIFDYDDVHVHAYIKKMHWQIRKIAAFKKVEPMPF